MGKILDFILLSGWFGLLCALVFFGYRPGDFVVGCAFAICVLHGLSCILKG